MALASALVIKNPELPWWRSAPEHWIYPIQTLVCGALLLWFRKDYAFKPVRGLGLATLLGVVGIAIWFLPAWLWSQWRASRTIAWLGFTPRLEGYDPTIFQSSPVAYSTDLVMRFLRLVVVVPLVEEIFWRGFLMRYVIAEGRPFESVPFGKHDWRAYGVTTVAFMLVHQMEDWLGALVFGSLMYFLCIRSKSLAACVWMHAVANLALGIYVMKTRQWGFW
jgi:CAAX prenyl protease-like protein